MNVSRSGSALLEEWIVQSSETWKSQLSVILGWRNGNYQMYDLLVKQEKEPPLWSFQILGVNSTESIKHL